MRQKVTTMQLKVMKVTTTKLKATTTAPTAANVAATTATEQPTAKKKAQKPTVMKLFFRKQKPTQPE